MLDGEYKNCKTGEIRYVMAEAYGVGPLVGKLVIITCNQDGEDNQAHLKGDFLLRFAEVKKVAA